MDHKWVCTLSEGWDILQTSAVPGAEVYKFVLGSYLLQYIKERHGLLKRYNQLYDLIRLIVRVATRCALILHVTELSERGGGGGKVCQLLSSSNSPRPLSHNPPIRRPFHSVVEPKD